MLTTLVASISSPPQAKLYEMTTSLKLWLNQFDVLRGQLWYIWHMFLENKGTYILIRAGADRVRHKHKQKSRCYPWTGAHQFKGFYFVICFLIASLLCQGTECGLIVSHYFHACSILLTFVWLPCGLKKYMRCGSWWRKYPFLSDSTCKQIDQSKANYPS